MTALELARRDYKKAKINLLRAAGKTPPEELERLKELRDLRLKIVKIMERNSEE